MSAPEAEPAKLWRDDIREPPDASWIWVRTVVDAIDAFKTGSVVEASLDHDLGLGLGLDEQGIELPPGRALVYWMAEHDRWPAEAIAIDSASPGRRRLHVGTIERYGPFRRVGRTSRFTRI